MNIPSWAASAGSFFLIIARLLLRRITGVFVGGLLPDRPEKLLEGWDCFMPGVPSEDHRGVITLF